MFFDLGKLFGVESSKGQRRGGQNMNASTVKRAPRKPASKGAIVVTEEMRAALENANPKMRKFVKETLKLQESGLLAKAFTK